MGSQQGGRNHLEAESTRSRRVTATLPASSRSQTQRAVECRLPAVIVWIDALDLSALRAVMSLSRDRTARGGGG
jgi:hypothetical protein